jgi:hypothetical protein
METTMQDSNEDPEIRKEIEDVLLFNTKLVQVQSLLAERRLHEGRRAARELVKTVARYHRDRELRERFIQTLHMSFGSFLNVSAILDEEFWKEDSKRRRGKY